MLEAQGPTDGQASSLWKNSDFLKLWSAQTISATGDQFTWLAIPLIATLTLGATASQMGYLTALGSVPYLLISLFVGIWADRLRRRPMLIMADLGRAIVLLTVPAAAMLHSLRMSNLFVVEFLVGSFSVVFDVSSQAFLPALMDKRSLIDANGKLETTRSITSIAGPSLAGFLIQVLSAPAVIILDALSFVCSAALIGVVRRPEIHQGQITRAPMLEEIREGLAYVLGNSYLRSITACTGTFNFFWAAVSALYIIFAVRELHLSPVRIGLIFGLGNATALLGAITAGWMSKHLGLGRTIIGAVLLSGISTVPLVLATPGNALGLLIVLRLLFSFSIPVYNINQVSLRQAITPHRLLGRMTASVRFLIWGIMPFGALVGGFLGQKLGLRTAMAIVAAGLMIPFLWVLFSPVRTLRTFPAAVN